MDGNEQSAAQQPAGPQDQVGGQQSDGAGMEALMELREQKTAEYLRAALAMEDPLVANVSVMNADLMFYAREIRRMIEPALKMAPAELRELANLFPAMDGALRVYRQSERFSTFVNRLKREREAAEKAAAKAAAHEAESGKAAG